MLCLFGHLLIGLEPPLKRLKTALDNTQSLEGDEYEKAVEDLKAEWEKGKRKRSFAIIKDLMTKTENGRRTWIMKERPLITDILAKYPCLSSYRIVS